MWAFVFAPIIFSVILVAIVCVDMEISGTMEAFGITVPNLPPSEINALQSLYDSTDGPNWQWLNGTNVGIPWVFNATSNPCHDNWQGVLCTAVSTNGYLHVQALKLGERGLRGPLPGGMDDMPFMEGFELNTNELTGSIPRSLGNLSVILLMNLADNQLTGSLPAELGNATTLRIINLNENKLTGTLPAYFATFPSLTNLVLDTNFIGGTIPASYGTLYALTILNLGVNELTGTVPPSLGNLTLLTQLELNSNFLSGLLPDMSRLTQLQIVYFDYNGFYGTIPAYFGSFTALEYITMNENYFTGTIPPELGNSRSLQDVYLHTNDLTGTLPPQLGQITSLQLLDVHDNYLTGTIPPELGNARALTVLTAYTNQFTGHIPPELGQLADLQTVDFSKNPLSGTLPRELAYLQQLQFLKIHKTGLHGPIMPNIANMTALSYLSLHDNLHTSTVPAGLKQLRFLNSLFIFNNRFTGAISNFLDPAVQGYLAIVQISGNRFTGQIPDSLFALPTLQTVILGDNCFHGSLPPAICNATTVTTLSLDGLRSGTTCQDVIFPGTSEAYVLTNHIRAGIPECLFEMPLLNTLHLSGNGLTGTIPSEVQISDNLVDLSLSHNKLTGAIPRVFQQRVWYNFDLSYNKFGGTLTNDFATVLGNLTVLRRLGVTVTDPATGAYTNPMGAVTLRNNRLSNTVPPIIRSMGNVSVLKGNLFGCDFEKHELPRHDDGRRTYVCGSNSFNNSYYIYICVMAAALCTVAAVYVWRDKIVAYVDVAATLATLHRWFAIVDWYDKDSERGKSRLHRYKYVTLLFDEVCKVAAWCTLYILVVEMPLYSLLSYFYGTHKFEYAYSVSAAFLSGAVALSLLLVFFIGMLVLLLYLYKLLMQVMKRFLHNLPRDFHFSVLDSFQDEEEGPDNRYSSLSEKIMVYVVFFLINVTVVGAANVGYVFAAIYAGSAYQTLAQLSLSVFKLIWNNFGSIYLIRWTHHYLASSASKSWRSKGAGFFSIQLFVQLFNYIVVPCVVVSAINPDCFNNTVVAAESVTSYFYYEECSVYSALFGCVQTKVDIASTTYSPPFTYSYECSSSLIAFYSPTYVYLGFIVTFVSPLWNAFMRWVHTKSRRGTTWFAIVDFWVPPILHPVSADTVQYDKPYDIFNPYIDANYILVTINAYLGVLLTFGLVFPPLAPVMLASMCSTVYANRIEVGRFLTDAIADNVHKYTDIIETECQGVGSVPKLIQNIRILLIFACLFYTPFLFDTLGDQVGIKDTYWLIIVVPLFPLIIWLLHRGYREYYRHCHPGGTRKPTVSTMEMRASNFVRSETQDRQLQEIMRTEQPPVHGLPGLAGLQDFELQSSAAGAVRLSPMMRRELRAESEPSVRDASEESSIDVYNALQQA